MQEELLLKPKTEQKLDNLDYTRYYTNFDREGNINFALTLILLKKDLEYFQKVCKLLEMGGVEYRVGTAGGGNQARQPYLEKYDWFKKQ